MIESGGVDSLVRLTELLAAHGVYALTVIAIFYLEWRMRSNLNSAAPRNHTFFRRVYACMVAVLIMLMAVSTTVWIYATFFYSYRGYVRGAVEDLTEQPVRPDNTQDPPKVLQQIVPQSFDIDLYQSKKIKEHDSTEGRYDLGWVLLPRDDVRTLGFRFQHHYEILGERGRLEPSADPTPAPGPAFEKRTISKKFMIDLQRINYAPGRSIDLVYEPDRADATRNVGRILMRSADALVEIPWEDNETMVRPTREPAHERASVRGWLPVVFAQSQAPAPKAPFGTGGEYDAQFGRLLRARLASPDLATQLQARRVLVASGSRAFPFIRETLQTPPGADHDAELLYQNLADALIEIETRGVRAPADIHLKLATAFYEAGDYGSAAMFFERAGNGPFDDEEIHFRRGFAYTETKQYPKAIREYETYLAKAQSPRPRAVALTNLAIVAEDQRRGDEAAAYYQRAIQTDPTYATPLNNLAYLYAERGERLTEALRLADRALDREPKSALIKDTKGWVLYKLGRYNEALPMLLEAASLAPDEDVIRTHLQMAEKATRSTATIPARR